MKFLVAIAISITEPNLRTRGAEAKVRAIILALFLHLILQPQWHVPLRAAVAGHALALAGGRAPVVRAQDRGVVLRGGLVEHRQQFVRLARQHLEIDNGVGAVALHRADHQIAVQVSSIQPRYRQAVTIAGQRRRIHARRRRLRSRRVHVMKEHIAQRPRNATTLVTDLKEINKRISICLLCQKQQQP